MWLLAFTRSFSTCILSQSKDFFPEDYPSQDELLRKLTEPVIKANYHSIINNHILGDIREETASNLFFYFLMFYSNTKLI